ncbi:MAG: hypothetical protein ABIR32_00540 [Ilumatobacteraceae bacterium]
MSTAAEHAREYLASAATRPVTATVRYDEIQARFDGPLPADGVAAEVAVAELIDGSSGGVLTHASGRFVGYVARGTLPAALAADWLVSAWDQNTALAPATPAVAAVEAVAVRWVVEALGLPADTSVGVTTGCQAVHLACCARGAAIRTRGGWLGCGGRGSVRRPEGASYGRRGNDKLDGDGWCCVGSCSWPA